MVSMKKLFAHLTVMLFVLLYTMDSTTANQQCKYSVMEIVMTQCSKSLMRNRRDLSEYLPNIQPNAEMAIPWYVIWDRRQPAPSRMHFRQASREPAPARFLPQERGDTLGFDLTPSEMDELYEEISSRSLRRSEKSQKEIRDIIEAAAKCCQNKELCSKEKSIIPCV